VELSLAPGPYLVGVASNATVTIADGTWYVATNGLDTHGGHSWSDAFLTISNAVAQAPAGQLILVSNGTYTVGAQIALSKQVLLHGFNGASNTIVNGNGAVRCFVLSHAGAVLDGFTATNGLSDGGGVYMTAGTVRNCTIRNNKSVNDPAYGNGIYMTGGLVTNCVIRDNSRSGGNNGYGGGVWMNNGTVANCLITGNKFSGSPQRSHGAGVEMFGGTVDSCVISSNSMSGATAPGGYVEGYGGGAGVLMFGGTLRKCRIFGNSNMNAVNAVGADGGGVQVQGGAVENCAIYDNQSYLNGGGVSLTAGRLCNVTISVSMSGRIWRRLRRTGRGCPARWMAMATARPVTTWEPTSNCTRHRAPSGAGSPSAPTQGMHPSQWFSRLPWPVRVPMERASIGTLTTTAAWMVPALISVWSAMCTRWVHTRSGSWPVMAWPRATRWCGRP
jgi:hypothetical protein